VTPSTGAAVDPYRADVPSRPRSLAAAPRRFRAYNPTHLDELLSRTRLSEEDRRALRAVAAVFPFRANSYVVDELIDWSAAPDDPIYRLTFPHADMLPAADLRRITGLLAGGAPPTALAAAARAIRHTLNPHPAGQRTHNTPLLAGRPLPGIQHKYPETVLFFPSRGQTCHAYCTYCFRWAQFVGEPELKIGAAGSAQLRTYLAAHTEVSDLLVTGGDPMIMSAEMLGRYLDPLLDDPDLEHITSFRIGTKSLAFWPQRYVTDRDADDLLRLLERVVASGRNLAIMAHFSHPRELEPAVVDDAVGRIRDTGAVIRTQAPLIRTVNDDAATWAAMWRRQVGLGMVPYYLFVERDTGPRDHFAVPLASAVRIFNRAYRQVSGLGRTVRGPVMSATPGKVCVDGVTDLLGTTMFTLHFIQCRDPTMVNQPFFAEYDPDAVWLTDLRPIPGSESFLTEWTNPPKLPHP
jgi:KamA family protein